MKAKKLALFGFTLFLFGYLNAFAAQAHTTLISEIPVGNSQITKLPSEVALTFDENLIVIGEANSLEVTDPNGSEITFGDVKITNNLLRRELKASSIPGTYSVTYRVVSEDGHVVSNTYKFVLKGKEISSGMIESQESEDEKTPLTPSASAPEKVTTTVNEAQDSHTGHSFWEHHAGHIFMAFAALILIYIWKKREN